MTQRKMEVKPIQTIRITTRFVTIAERDLIKNAARISRKSLNQYCSDVLLNHAKLMISSYEQKNELNSTSGDLI